MFELSVVNEPVSSKQRAMIRVAIDRVFRDGSFTYTELLMVPEPARTMALEYIDGMESTNGFPAVSGSPIDTGLVRIICLDKNDTIKVSRWGKRNIYGTTVEAPPQKYQTVLGNDALVPDTYPERAARNVIRQRGFPSRDVASRGTNSGSVVEWKWLERRAKEPDAPSEILDIYKSILERITAPGSEAPAVTAKSKSPGDKQLPVHP